MFRELISTVYQGDCMDFMRTLPDNFFDYIVDDFQYGIGADKMGYNRKQDRNVKQKNGETIRFISGGLQETNWDTEVPTQEYFDEACRVSRNQIMFGIEYVDWTGVGPGRIRWNKMVAEGCSFKKYELAYCSFIEHTHEINLLHSGMMQAKSIAEPTVMQGNKKLNEKRIHRTQKPVLLYDIINRDFIPQGSKIGDMHLGSGSSRISAHKWDCDFWGAEINPVIYKDEQKRFQKYMSQGKLQLF